MRIKLRFNFVIILMITMLCCGCRSIKPRTIFSERECEMSRVELAETITNILKMNNFTIIFNDTNMISGISDADFSFGFSSYFNRAKIEKYKIKWDFIISNSGNKFKVVSTCSKINNAFRANISLKDPYLNYNENIFPVGKNYQKDRTDAGLYYAIIDALRHICEIEIEYYRDKYDRELRYDVVKNKFYIIQN